MRRRQREWLADATLWTRNDDVLRRRDSECVNQATLKISERELEPTLLIAGWRWWEEFGAAGVEDRTPPGARLTA